jgi:hypothetical protein
MDFSDFNIVREGTRGPMWSWLGNKIFR